MAAHLVSVESRPNPILAFETRPSQITGLAWYAVLAYKEHSFEEILPFDFPVIREDETRFALEINPILERMRAKLAPILVMEDEEQRKKLKSRVKLRKKGAATA
jgi:hypothetical protein